MLKHSQRIALCLVLLMLNCAYAQVSAQYPFQNLEQQKRFAYLTERLRCVVCQNQNLAESNADIAVDLKDGIYHAILEDEADETIIENLRLRYGDFILFSPPMTAKTLLLWFGPLAMFLLGLFYIKRMFKK